MSKQDYRMHFALGGALVAACLVAVFVIHAFKSGGESSAGIDARRSVSNALTLPEIRREEDASPPPSRPVRTGGGVQFYVASDGRPDGDGSKRRPWDLTTALAQPARVKAGDTIWLRGGVYKGAFKSRLNGYEGRSILLAQFADERATIDGSLTVEGAWATFWGFEVTNSDTDRTRARPTGVEVSGAHTKFINLVVHDCGNGVAFWSPALDSELYGNIIYNNGWQTSAVERGHGHAIYTQNETGTKLIRDNILFNQFGWGIHAYTEEGEIQGFEFEGNVSFNNGAATVGDERYDNILVGGERPAARIALERNYTFHTPSKDATKPNVRLHYGAKNNRDLTVRNNYFAGGSLVLSVSDWQQVTLTGNRFYGLNRLLALNLPEHVAASIYTWDGNTYTQNSTEVSAPFTFQDSALSFAEWQQKTGFDRRSTWSSDPRGRPAGVDVFVRPNVYETGRAHVVVYNWILREAVEADLKDVLKVGEQYEVRDAQNYFGSPVLRGTYDGKPLSIPLRRATTVAPLVGGRFRFDSTAPEFCVYVVLRKSGG